MPEQDGSAMGLRGGAKGAPFPSPPQRHRLPAAGHPLHPIAQWIAQANIRRHPNARQGDCLFLAVAQALRMQGHVVHHTGLRQAAAALFRGQPGGSSTTWDGRTPTAPSMQTMCTWEEHTTAIRLPGALGSPLELQVLTQMYPEVFFLILGPGLKPCTICAQYQSPPDVAHRIDLWLEGGHYELLRTTVPPWVWEMVWAFDTERNAARVADVGVITVPDTPPSCPAANHIAWDRRACPAANARSSF